MMTRGETVHRNKIVCLRIETRTNAVELAQLQQGT